MFLCITSLEICIALFAILAICAIVVIGRCRNRNVESLRTTPVGIRSSMVKPLIEELRPRALSYAIYKQCLELRVRPSTKKILCERYGDENMLPKLEQCSLFAQRPELMSDREFLNEVNDWIVRNGGDGATSFFDASMIVGELLYKILSPEAKKIVQGVC